ncbi:acyltransferase [Candidatus Protofrankia datiscae]|uniref:acyltransferase n=1 Tax=Protofrankia TaxID=2994361 RepID=UPI003D66DAF7
MAKPVAIGNDCWLGSRVIVMSGVTIGHHCVIATGSLVNRDCKPYGLYAGSPARRVHDLAPEEATAPRESPAPRENPVPETLAASLTSVTVSPSAPTPPVTASTAAKA